MQKSEQDQTVYGTDLVLRDIANERKRQVVVEGFARTSDDEQPAGRLALAGAAYAVHWASFVQAIDGMGLTEAQAREAIEQMTAPEFWPMDPDWWKPHNSRDDLVRAAALLVAEIERLDRNLQIVGAVVVEPDLNWGDETPPTESHDEDRLSVEVDGRTFASEQERLEHNAAAERKLRDGDA